MTALVEKSIMGCWSRFSGHTASTLHMLLLALFTPLPTFCCHPVIKEIKQDAAVACMMWVMTLRPFNYITMFHLACQPPVEDLQPCATDMDSGLCGLLNAAAK